MPSWRLCSYCGRLESECRGGLYPSPRNNAIGICIGCSRAAARFITGEIIDTDNPAVVQFRLRGMTASGYDPDGGDAA